MVRPSTAVMTGVVILVWLLTAAVTKYSLTEAALLMPLVLVVLGATAAVIIFWARVARGPENREPAEQRSCKRSRRTRPSMRGRR